MKWLALGLLLLSAPALAQEERAEEAPKLENWVSLYGSGFGFVNHSYREGGGEGQLRVDLWKGLTWSAHAAYTGTAFVETDTDGSRTVSFFHDLLIGGKWAPSEETPFWLWGEAHGLYGSTTYGSGGGFLAGVGYLWKETRFELGGGGLWLQGDRSLNVSAQVSRAFSPWLEVTLLGLFTRNDPDDSEFGTGGNHYAYGAGLKLGPFEKTVIGLRWIGGERVLAMERQGTIVENLPDTLKHTFTATVSYPIANDNWVSFGSNVRVGDQYTGQTYVIVSGFVGVGFRY